MPTFLNMLWISNKSAFFFLLQGNSSLKECKVPAGVSDISGLNTYIDIENDVDMAFTRQKRREFEVMFD